MVIVNSINLEPHLEELVKVIRESFLTVANELHLTRENAKTNPAFIESKDILKSVKEKKVEFYGCFKKEVLIGCYALENAGENIFYLERLAVIPEERHKGIGRELVLDCLQRVKRQDGEKVSIGIIDENKVLKNWYKKIGFIETGIREFSHLPFRVCFMEYGLIKG